MVGALVGRLLFRDVETVEVRDLGASFRRVSFHGESLRGVSWEPGDKIQVIGGVLMILVGAALVTGLWNDFVSWVRDAFVSDVRLPI